MLLCLFILLGVWQIQRYHYKKALLQEFQHAAHSPPQRLSQVEKLSNIRFQHIHVQGYYINDKTMLVQNKIYNKQLGFDVLTPLQVTRSQKVLLVNRGWVAMQSSHKAPPIKPVNNLQILTGTIKILKKHPFILGKNILSPTKWPIVMQKIDLTEISKLTHFKLYPFVLQLDANQPNGFVREWDPVTVKAHKHLGYAVQWFGLALALICVYWFLIRKKE